MTLQTAATAIRDDGHLVLVADAGYSADLLCRAWISNGYRKSVDVD